MAGGGPAQPGSEHATDPVPVLGSVGSLVQISTAGPHQRLLRGEDCHLLRLAGLLHGLAAPGLCGWRRGLCVRPAHPRPELRGHGGLWELGGKVRAEQCAQQPGNTDMFPAASVCVRNARNARPGRCTISVPTPGYPICSTTQARFSMQSSCLSGVNILSVVSL